MGAKQKARAFSLCSTHVSKAYKICATLLRESDNRVRLFFVGLLVCLHIAEAAQAASVSIAWDPPNPSNNVAGYRVYYGLISREYGGSTNIGNLTTCRIDGLDTSATHYFAITAFSKTGAESDFSSELVWDNVAPTISGPERLMLARGSVPMLMPDLRKSISVVDDFSSFSDLAVSQKPAPGTVLLRMPTVAVFRATDEAGNTGGIVIPVALDAGDDGGGGTFACEPRVTVSVAHGQALLSYTISGSPPDDLLSNDRRHVDLEWCTNLWSRAWHPVAGYENVQETTFTTPLHFLPSARSVFFRVRVHGNF